MADERQTRFAASWPARLRTGGAVLALWVVVAGCGGNPIDQLRARLELKEGNKSYLRGEFGNAIEHYEQALSYVPTLQRAALNRAYSNVALFRASNDGTERDRLAVRAVLSFQQYLEIAEANPGGGTGPGRERVEQHILTLYLDSQRPDKAVQFLRARHERDPRDVSTLQMLANLDAERGELDHALEWHQKIIALDPDRPEVHYALGVLAWRFSYFNMVSSDRRGPLLDEGLTATLRAVELRPDYFEALTYVNLLYREKAKHAKKTSERKEYEKLYQEYESKAREVRDQQMKESSG